MSERLKQLQELEAQLHEANLEFSLAARPLDRLSEMNIEQREQLADQLRIRQARWDSVTQAISQTMRADDALASRPPAAEARRTDWSAEW